MYNVFSFKELFKTTVHVLWLNYYIAINDHNDAMILSIGHFWYKTKHNFFKQEGHSGPESLTCTMCTSLVQWKVMI